MTNAAESMQQHPLDTDVPSEKSASLDSHSNNAEYSENDDDDATSPSSTTYDIPQGEVEEPWADWIRRSTRAAEECLKRLNIDDWRTLLRRRKWRWVQHLATTEAAEWATLALKWTPELDLRYNATRRTGRPKLRWIHDLRQYLCAVCDDAATTTILPDFITSQSSPSSITPTQLLSIASTTVWETLEEGYVRRP